MPPSPYVQSLALTFEAYVPFLVRANPDGQSVRVMISDRVTVTELPAEAGLWKDLVLAGVPLEPLEAWTPMQARVFAPEGNPLDFRLKIQWARPDDPAKTRAYGYTLETVSSELFHLVLAIETRHKQFSSKETNDDEPIG